MCWPEVSRRVVVVAGTCAGSGAAFGISIVERGDSKAERDGMESGAGAGGREGEAKRSEARELVVPKYKVQTPEAMHAGAAPNYWVLTGSLTGAWVEPGSVYSS